jgi:hypothetical protein
MFAISNPPAEGVDDRPGPRHLVPELGIPSAEAAVAVAELEAGVVGPHRHVDGGLDGDAADAFSPASRLANGAEEVPGFPGAPVVLDT